MTDRTPARTAQDGMVDMGSIGATAVEETTSTVTATVVGSGAADLDLTEDHADDLDVEQITGCDIWSDAALLSRPAAPTSEGACEALFVRRGDTREVIGTKDRRWQVELEEGEVVVRALGEGAPTIRLHPDGTITVTGATIVLAGDTVKIGDAGATQKIALGTALKTHLDDIKTFLDAVKTHTHTVALGVATASSQLAIAPVPTVPDVESRHTVEN